MRTSSPAATIAPLPRWRPFTVTHPPSINSLALRRDVTHPSRTRKTSSRWWLWPPGSTLVVRDAVAHPTLDLLEKTRERILVRCRHKIAFTHKVERTRIVFETVAQFFEHEEAGVIQ